MSHPTGWPAPRASPYVKICGLTTPALADAAAGAGAEMIGIVHFAPSRRHLEVARAQAVADAVRPRAMVVALTVDADDATLDALVATVRPDALQLHGKEDSARVTLLAQRYGLAIAKSVSVRAPGDAAVVTPTEALTLYDAAPPQDAACPGGNGTPFDWALLSGPSVRLPYMLSGGLTAENVGGAIRTLQPYAVDTSSGVETGPRKDPLKMARFVAACRDAGGVGARAMPV